MSELGRGDGLDHLVHGCHVGTPLMAALHPDTGSASVRGACVQAAHPPQHLGMLSGSAPDAVSRLETVRPDSHSTFVRSVLGRGWCGDNFGEAWPGRHAIWTQVRSSGV